MWPISLLQETPTLKIVGTAVNGEETGHNGGKKVGGKKVKFGDAGDASGMRKAARFH